MQGFNPPVHEYPPPKEGEPALHRAARTGDCAEIRRLVAAGERLDATFNTELDPGAYEREATPLMIAAGSSDGANEETLKVLIELGADPKVVIHGRSAATFACEGLSCWHKAGGDAQRLRFVLKAGCPLPANPERRNRLLCETAGGGDPARLSVLLEHGLSARGHWDPVKAREKHRAMMEHMAKYRSDQPDIFASLPAETRAAMAESMKKSEEEMFEQQTSGPSSNEIPLFCAAESGSGECVRLLLDAGADPKARDSSKRTAVYFANSAAALRELLEAGLTIEDADQYNWSPLDSAVSDGEEALPRIRALIEAGANVNATHDRGYTVFMSAVGSSRHPAVLRLLIESGADPHAVTELGYNAFHAAVDVNFDANTEESVRDTLGYLKQLGVNIEQRNKRDQTPLARAIQEGTGLEVQVLCELGADPNVVCPKHECSGDACTRIDLPLLFHAADGIGVNRDVKTEALLKAGADPLVKDADGFMPLMQVLAAICRDATNYEKSYNEFFKGLGKLRLDGKSMPKSREEFVTQASPLFREYVEKFAAEIPVPEGSEYEEEWRKERVSCLVLLCAYEGWARHEKRNEKSGS